MRKLRKWLMGFGIGLIVGASMLQLITFAKDQAAKVTEERLSPERIGEEADKAGLILLTREQLNARLEEAAAQAAPKTGKAEEEASPEPEASEKPNDSEPNATVPPDDSSPEPEEPSPSAETTSLYVAYGMSLTEVGEELQRLGLIGDVKDFIENARPIAKKMKVGTAVFSGKPSYEAIMDELVRKK